MIADNCPFGKLSCDGCSKFTTGGCLEKQNCSQAFFITHNDMVAMWERKKDALMKLSKEELVELIIGKKENVGMTFWDN